MIEQYFDFPEQLRCLQQLLILIILAWYTCCAYPDQFIY